MCGDCNMGKGKATLDRVRKAAAGCWAQRARLVALAEETDGPLSGLGPSKLLGYRGRPMMAGSMVAGEGEGEEETMGEEGC